MADEPNIQRILEYLRQYAAEYDLDTLRQQLHATGYATADIDAAIERFTTAGAQTPPMEATSLLPEAHDPEPVPPIVDVPSSLPEAHDPEPQEAPPQAPIPATLDRAAIVGRIEAYLGQHQGSYELGALRSQAIAAGYPPELVEEAIQRLGQAAPPQQPGSFRKSWLPGCGIWLFNMFLSGLLVVIAGAVTNDVWSFLVSLLPLLLVVEFVGGFVLRGRGQAAWGNALIWGVIHSVLTTALLALALILGLALIFGACYQILQGQ